MGVRYKVDSSFFEQWNNPMAYFLGYLYADGSMEDSPKIRGHYVRASSIDYSLLENFRSRLNSEHTISPMRLLPPFETQRWMIRIGNNQLYESLLRKGLTPRKSLTMTLPKIPPAQLGAFTRGYFDGDGCVFVERQQVAPDRFITKRLRTIFTSGSKQFLVALYDQLVKHQSTFLTGKLYTTGNVHHLIYPTAQSVVLFTVMYRDVEQDLMLLRKFERYQQYFHLQTKHLNPEVKEILGRVAQW